MFRASFILRGCSASRDPSLPDRAIGHLLEALASWNCDLLRSERRAGRPLPPVYQSGVRYAREREWIRLPNGSLELEGLEDWIDALEAVRRGQADCEDLACWRAAELRLAGHPRARVVFNVAPGRTGRLFHILVDRGDGELEDPSRALGMRP